MKRLTEFHFFIRINYAVKALKRFYAVTTMAAGLPYVLLRIGLRRAGKQKMHDDTAAEKKYGIEYAH